MRKSIIYLPALISLLFISCMRDEEFVSKQYPIIQTGNVSNIDSNGVRFTGEFLNLGSSEIMEYGFVFGDIDPKIEYSNKIIIESKAKVGKFSQYIEKNIAGNINYNVKAYAKTSDYIIYGNNIVFTSTGSKYNPLDLVLHASIYGWFDLHGFSNNELGFILFQSGHFYSYNPKTNSIVKKQNSPIDGNSGTIFASFGLGSNLYVISNISSSVFVYDSENNQWSNLGKSPFSTNGGFLGFSINNNGYFLSRNYFYSYNKSTGTWLKKTNIPSAHLYSAQVAENKVYVMGDGKDIWMYSPETDNWQKVSTYPGVWHGKIIGFSQNNKIYWGLSYYGVYSGDSAPATDFWEYDPGLNNWKQIDNFPLIHSQYEIFTFSIDSLSYFGYNNPDYSKNYEEYLLFKFDSRKIK